MESPQFINMAALRSVLPPYQSHAKQPCLDLAHNYLRKYRWCASDDPSNPIQQPLWFGPLSQNVLARMGNIGHGSYRLGFVMALDCLRHLLAPVLARGFYCALLCPVASRTEKHLARPRRQSTRKFLFLRSTPLDIMMSFLRAS